MPIRQEMYFDAIELYSDEVIANSGKEPQRYSSLFSCLGTKLVEKI